MSNIDLIKEKINRANNKLSLFFDIENFKNKSENDIRLKIVDNTMQNYYEKNFGKDNYNEYINYINNIKLYLDNYYYKKEEIKIDYILGLHKIIMEGLWTEDKTTIGQVRKGACVSRGKLLIKKAKIVSFLAPKYLDRYIKEAILNYNNNIKFDSLTSIVNIIMDFWMYIHPFNDGNGKVCYILIDTLLWKYGFWPIFLSHPSNKMLFRELLEDYSNNKNLIKAKINFYKIILKIYSNYQIK